MLVQQVITAGGAFMATNVDDIVLLTLLFSGLPDRSRALPLVGGQVIGFSLLVLISLLGLLGHQALPQNGVALQWGEAAGAAASPDARVVLLPEGKVLTVGDATPPTAAAAAASRADAELSYALSLPAFALQPRLPQGGSLPALSQDELDALPESAPLD